MTENNKKLEYSSKIDINSCRIKDVAKVFGVTIRGVDKWIKEGIPRNPDKTFSLNAVIGWYIDKKAKGKGQKDKIKAEVERLNNINQKLRLELKKMNEEVISRQKVVEIAIQQALALKNFLMETVHRNVDLFIMKNRDELIVLFEEFVSSLLKKFVESGDKLEI